MSDFTCIFNNLAGEWKLSRIISSGERFAGIANFQVFSNSEYILTENGKLHLKNGKIITATREWHWAYSDQNGLIISYDEDAPRLYHRLRLKDQNGLLTGKATHFCEPDTYKGSYQFSCREILVKQKISGPNKSYFVESIYQKF